MTARSNQGDRRRMSDDELRRRMLDAAQELVAAAGGLTVGLDHLSFEEAIKRADVARSSVYRIWPSRNDFHRDLLRDLAGPSWQGTAAFDQQTVNLVSDIVADRLHLLVTKEGRRLVLKEAVRQGATHNFEAVVMSPHWRTYVALTATILSTPDPEMRETVRGALQAAERVFIQRMVEFYEDMAVILGLTLRAPYEGYETLAAAGAAVVEGLALRELLMPEVVGKNLMLEGPDGSERWTLPAVAFMGVLNELVELSDDYQPAGALQEYLKRLAARDSGDSPRVSSPAPDAIDR